MDLDYEPSPFWEERLRKHFSLVGTGRVSFSSRYNHWLYRAKLRALQQVWQTLDFTPSGKSILDVGCGTGFFVTYYQAQGCASLTGIDITQISIEYLQQQFPQFTFYRRDIGTTWEEPLPAFDIVHVFDVLYHLTSKQRFHQALINLSQLTATGGYLLMTDYGGVEERYPDSHVVFHSLPTYQHLLQQHGLTLCLVLPVYYLLNRRLFSAFFSRRNTLLARVAHRLDQGGAPCWYFLDGLLLSQQRANMRLLVAHKKETDI